MRIQEVAYNEDPCGFGSPKNVCRSTAMHNHITKLFVSFHIQMRQRQDMDEVCYEKVVEFVRAGHQVMVFVHARNATVNTAMVLKETAHIF